jgi:hypothetical protein
MKENKSLSKKKKNEKQQYECACLIVTVSS